MEMTCAASLMGTLKTRESSGSMGSQMRCTAMLANVPKDNRKIARRVAGDSSWEVWEGVWCEVKAWRLYYEAEPGGSPLVLKMTIGINQLFAF